MSGNQNKTITNGITATVIMAAVVLCNENTTVKTVKGRILSTIILR